MRPKNKTILIIVLVVIVFCLLLAFIASLTGLLVLLPIFKSSKLPEPTQTNVSSPVVVSTEVPKLPTTAPTSIPTQPLPPTAQPTEPPAESTLTTWTTPAGLFYFDPAVWEVSDSGWLHSRALDDCWICFDCGHGYDPALFTIDEYSEFYGTTRLSFYRFRWKTTDEPAFSVVNWGEDLEYLYEIRSETSGWACFDPALEVFIQSAERGFR